MPKVTIEKYKDDEQEFKVGDVVEVGEYLIKITAWSTNKICSGVILNKDISEIGRTIVWEGYKKLARKFRGKIIIEQE